MSKKTGSRQRVLDAASKHGLDITILEMPESTRTAQEAADACDCEVDRIVKSLIFEAANSGKLALFLVSGVNQADPASLEKALGETVQRADPKKIREVTGFAIGGVAPIGHIAPIAAWIDSHLLSFDTVWAAAGAPNSVFNVNPKDLMRACGAELIDFA